MRGIIRGRAATSGRNLAACNIFMLLEVPAARQRAMCAMLAGQSGGARIEAQQKLLDKQKATPGAGLYWLGRGVRI